MSRLIVAYVLAVGALLALGLALLFAIFDSNSRDALTLALAAMVQGLGAVGLSNHKAQNRYLGKR